MNKKTKKHQLSTLLASSIITTTPYLAHAYPIFYKCDANRGFSDVLTGPELDQKIRAFVELPKAQKLSILSKACEGLQDCRRQLGQIADLAEFDQDLAQQTLEKELNKLQGNGSSPIRKVSSETYDLQKAIRSAYFETAACRNTMSDLPNENFLTQRGAGNDNVLIYFPYESEYTYVTGCRPHESGHLICMPNNKEGIQKTVRSALLMGADPYAYLALGLMEGGANGWNTLYLDPIGKMKAMGCREEKTDVTKSSPNKLNSFGNFHQIVAGTHRDPELSNRLKKYLSAQGESVKDGKSYFCRELSTANSSVLSSPDRDQCCVELDFNLETSSDANKQMMGQSNGLESAFIFEHVRQVLNSQLPGKSDPAFRLQHFNGFSKLMGGGEGVSTFRSGVNYFDDPAYGYQAMDYIMNSLATNPWIRSEVERQAKELKVKAPSVLCMDVPVPGIFQIDSDSYFKKHHDTPRLKAIRGKKFAQMSEREKKVFMQELRDPKVSQLLKDKLGTAPAMAELNAMNLDALAPTETVTTVKLKDGSGYVAHLSTVTALSPVPELKVEKIGNYSGPIPKDYSEIGQIALNVEKAKKGITVSSYNGKYHYKFSEDYPLSAQELQSTVMMGISIPSKDVSKITYDNGWTIKPKTNGQMLEGYEYFDPQGKKIESQDFMVFQAIADKGYKVELLNGSGYTVKIEKSQEEDTQNPFDSLTVGLMGAVNKKTIQYADGTEYELQSEFKQTNQKKSEAKVPVDFEKFTQTYWSDVYSKRDTISKSSPLPWTKMSDARLKEIAQRIRGSQNNNMTGYPYMGLDMGLSGGGLGGGIVGGGMDTPAAQPSSAPTPPQETPVPVNTTGSAN